MKYKCDIRTSISTIYHQMKAILFCVHAVLLTVLLFFMFLCSSVDVLLNKTQLWLFLSVLSVNLRKLGDKSVAIQISER